jgi:hypothetical protein
MGGAEIESFLTDLAVKGHVSASTQSQAFFALLFLVSAGPWHRVAALGCDSSETAEAVAGRALAR